MWVGETSTSSLAGFLLASRRYHPTLYFNSKIAVCRLRSCLQSRACLAGSMHDVVSVLQCGCLTVVCLCAAGAEGVRNLLAGGLRLSEDAGGHYTLRGVREANGTRGARGPGGSIALPPPAAAAAAALLPFAHVEADILRCEDCGWCYPAPSSAAAPCDLASDDAGILPLDGCSNSAVLACGDLVGTASGLLPLWPWPAGSAALCRRSIDDHGDDAVFTLDDCPSTRTSPLHLHPRGAATAAASPTGSARCNDPPACVYNTLLVPLPNSLAADVVDEMVVVHPSCAPTDSPWGGGSECRLQAGRGGSDSGSGFNAGDPLSPSQSLLLGAARAAGSATVAAAMRPSLRERSPRCHARPTSLGRALRRSRLPPVLIVYLHEAAQEVEGGGRRLEEGGAATLKATGAGGSGTNIPFEPPHRHVAFPWVWSVPPQYLSSALPATPQHTEVQCSESGGRTGPASSRASVQAAGGTPVLYELQCVIERCGLRNFGDGGGGGGGEKDGHMGGPPLPYFLSYVRRPVVVVGRGSEGDGCAVVGIVSGPQWPPQLAGCALGNRSADGVGGCGGYQWFCIRDASVTAVEPSHVAAAVASVLCYVRIDG